MSGDWTLLVVIVGHRGGGPDSRRLAKRRALMPFPPVT